MSTLPNHMSRLSNQRSGQLVLLYDLFHIPVGARLISMPPASAVTQRSALIYSAARTNSMDAGRI